jgi:hypothetical protein
VIDHLLVECYISNDTTTVGTTTLEVMGSGTCTLTSWIHTPNEIMWQTDEEINHPYKREPTNKEQTSSLNSKLAYEH